MPAIWIPKRLVDLSLINTRGLSKNSFIRHCEFEYESRVYAAAKEIIEENRHIIMLTGPSASGKTTTAHKLRQHFEARGRNSRVLSLDDFYLNPEDGPHFEDGTPDFESVDALDIPCINRCIKELLETGRTLMPLFDFHTHSRSEQWEEILCGEDDVIIMEGLHALNPRLTDLADGGHITRAYVSARSKFMDGEETLIEPKELRLMRRMVRDVAKRSTSPAETIAMWQKVCDGERQYIDPFRDEADFKIDSTMDYEPCIFRSYLEPFMVQAVDMDETSRQALVELWNKLTGFHDIRDASPVPQDSVIREFIGAGRGE
mgnify:CR=1 FL=1